MQLYFTSTFRFIPCHVYRECICIWTRVYVCAGRNRIRNRIRIPTPKLESPDTLFVVLGRSFSLTLQCSAPSAHIAARRAARRAASSFLVPFPIPPLRALVRHIGKSFWQNCGTKGARYCIADSVCGCVCVYVYTAVCASVCLLPLLHLSYQYKCTYHKHVWSLPFPQVNSLRCIDSCQSRHIEGFLSSVSCGRCTK